MARRRGTSPVPQTLTQQDNHKPAVTPQLGAGPYDNARIADIGLSRLGRREGQCKQAVNNWVAAASGGRQRLCCDYHGNYAANGGIQNGRDQAVKGDIIQLSNPRDRAGYYWPMHTAVVVGHQRGSNTFDVVDSNSRNDEIARHHTYDPYAAAAGRGLEVAIWRMGTDGHVTKPPQVVRPQPVESDGDGVPDSDDHCPTVAGSDGLGCPEALGDPSDANGDGKTDLIHRWSAGVNTWLSAGDGTYTLHTLTRAGYNFAEGQWPASPQK